MMSSTGTFMIIPHTTIQPVAAILRLCLDDNNDRPKYEVRGIFDTGPVEGIPTMTVYWPHV